MKRSLVFVMHGEAGVGKSWLSDTAPPYRLHIDAEGGTRFLTDGPRVEWDPFVGPPPVADGSWRACTALTRDFQRVDTVIKYIESRNHSFRSIVLDSETEIQKQCLRSITGIQQPRTQDYGELLRTTEDSLRRLHDACLDPLNPLEVVVVICLSSEKGQEQAKVRPHVLGQLSITIAAMCDVCGYLYVAPDPETQQSRRMLLVQPIGNVVAKDRSNRLGTVVADPNIEHMLAEMYPTHPDSVEYVNRMNGAHAHALGVAPTRER